MFRLCSQVASVTDFLASIPIIPYSPCCNRVSEVATQNSYSNQHGSGSELLLLHLYYSVPSKAGKIYVPWIGKITFFVSEGLLSRWWTLYYPVYFPVPLVIEVFLPLQGPGLFATS